MIMKAPRSIAIAPLPGTPNAMVGIRSPPSLELLAAPGPKTPRTFAFPKPLSLLGVFGALHCVSVGHPLGNAASDPRHDADKNADSGATEDGRQK